MGDVLSTSTDISGDRRTADIAQEQDYLAALYDRLDNLRDQASQRLATALAGTGGTPQARSERDSAINLYTDQIAQYNAVENGLYFGRLDFDGDAPRHVGRIGLFDDDGDHLPLLVDWRAPAARPFYLATAASPDGVRRRRHVRTRHRTVTALDDEVLDLDAARRSRNDGLTGEAALFAALDAGRTGRMRDIVETIQAEQDRIIRARLDGILVVQGGPGTGKTAVALHRAAYLLYTYRQQLSTRAVLVVGPNATFLRYISQVLPALAETGVLLRTVGELYPGLTARGTEPAETAEVKGRLEMAGVLAAAVRDRQELPDEPLDVVFERETLRLDRETVERARARARATGRLHNQARSVFAQEIRRALAEQFAARIGTDPYADDPLGEGDAPGEPLLLDRLDIADIAGELANDPGVAAALDRLWPILTPQRLVSDLFASAQRIAAAGPALTDAQRQLLRRDPALPWTPADVPLLDEAAELLGEDETPAASGEDRRLRERIEYARGALDIAEGSRSIDLEDEADPELLRAADLLDAARLDERHVGRDRPTAAQRAAADRRWAFGHIIVDEAQELSSMAWRLLMRRCPARSMTVVGDVTQTGDLAGTSTWRQVFEPYVADRWRLAELSVSYRTPAEIMAAAAGVLAVIDPARTPPRSVRETGVAPWHEQVGADQLAARLVDVVRKEVAGLGEGRIGVLVPAGRAEVLGRAVVGTVPGTAIGADPDLEHPVVVLTVRQAKGLEFDSVVVVDPAGIIAESARGHNDLYVALTRATQRMGVLYPGELPSVLASLDRPGPD